MDKPPVLSAIMPLYRWDGIAREALAAVAASDYPSLELLVADDSPAGVDPGDLPAGARVVRTGGGRGPAAARNIAVAASIGELLLFVDADVVVRPDTAGRLAAEMRAAAADGVVALLSPCMRWTNFCSTYKNIFMHYSFARIEGRSPSFYTCCALVSRRAFQAAGGFEGQYREPAIEDTDMGHRLAAAGATVLASRSVMVEHVKRYTMCELIALDFGRAAALIRLFLRRRCFCPGPGATSVPGGFILSGALSLSGVFALVRGVASAKPLYAGWALACWAAIVLVNRGFIGSIRRTGGFRRAFQAALFLPVDLLISCLGSLWGLMTFMAGRRY
ncbi:MAG: glycosyltransferase [Candidatus Aureabacteria bacterium]|nr:glycosyltransferase [Candidatus Auribacterota bacterium]